MNKQRQEKIYELLKRGLRLIETGEELPFEWEKELFPIERREYELIYRGKETEEQVIADTIAVPFQEVSTFGTNGVDWNNKIVFGDNLQAMKTLLEIKKNGKLCNSDGTPGVRVVYIDPPFASKQEFRGSRDEKAYQDKVAGAEFVEFVRRRLVLLHELLSDDGSIFLHMDQRKVHYMKAIMDEVFGEQNFRNEIILPGRAAKNLQKQFVNISRLNVRHDTLLWYSKRSDTRFKPHWIEKHKQGNPEGHWHHFWSTADRATMRYKLFGIKPKTGQWTWKEERALTAVENYKRFLKEGGGRTLAEYWRDTGCALSFLRKDPDDGKPQYWRAPADQRLADTVWAGVPIYSNDNDYPTEKSEVLLAEIINLASGPGDLILDAFAGSGTTVAVAEKLQRRWITIDCGKLSIYTVQKRMLNLRKEIGNKGRKLKAKPFTLYNAGLYDFETLRNLPWEDWRFFALQLFECKDEPHKIHGFQMDGKRQGSSVHVFNHFHDGRVSRETVADLHASIGKTVGDRCFIIAPRGAFLFQEDYIEKDDVRYYALRIPYSFINELHRREFSALVQPMDEVAINQTVEAVGFDFIQSPLVELNIKPKKDFISVKIEEFESRARLRGEEEAAKYDSLSMVMVDFDYDGKVFDLDKVIYAHEAQDNQWQFELPTSDIEDNFMLVFLDIYGNEARIVVDKKMLSPKRRKAKIKK